MNKLSYNADAMRDAMEIACQVWAVYGEFPNSSAQMVGIRKLIYQRRLPYDDAVFQAAYAAICLERGLQNQYITIDVSAQQEGEASCE